MRTLEHLLTVSDIKRRAAELAEVGTMNKTLQAVLGAVLALLVSLSGAAIVGLFKLNNSVTRLVVQVEELQKTVANLERRNTYFHGDAGRP